MNDKKSSGEIRPHVRKSFEKITKGREELHQKLAQTDRHDRHMEVGKKIMDENREALKKLADS